MASGSRVVRRSRAVIRSRSSAAALRLKVSTSTRSGSRPRRSIRSATAATMVVVLPVPGPASTSSGPAAWSTTACCASSRRAAGAAGTGRRTRRYAGAWACSITVDSSRRHRHFAVVPSDPACRPATASNPGNPALDLQVRRVRVQDHPEHDIVLEEGLEGTEQEGEALGRVERAADLGVAIAAEPGLGDVDVGAFGPRDEAELNRGRTRWIVAAPGEAEPAVLLEADDRHLTGHVVHLPGPGEPRAGNHRTTALGEPEPCGQGRVDQGREDVSGGTADQHADLYSGCPGEPERRHDALLGISQGCRGRAWPVSSSDLRLDRTAAQPAATPSRSVSSGRLSWLTVSRTMSPYCSMLNVTRDGPPGGSWPGAAHVRTSRVGGELSVTVPATSATPDPSARWCSQPDPARQSDTLACPQYWAVSSASVSACQTRSGVLWM